MCIENRLASLAYKCVVCALAGAGLFWHSGIATGGFRPFMLGYFTTAVSLLVFLYYLVDIGFHLYGLARYGRHGTTSANRVFKCGLVVAALMTATIYAAVLAENSLFAADPATRLPGVILHVVVPVLVLFDYIFFEAKGRLRFSWPLVWLGLPLLYYMGVLSSALFGVRYMGGARFPYPFLDVDALGWGGVVPALLAIAGLWLLYGLLLVGLDRLMAGWRRPMAQMKAR